MAVLLLHEFNLSPIGNWLKQGYKNHPFTTICKSDDLETLKLAAGKTPIADIKGAFNTTCDLSNLNMFKFLLGHPSVANLPEYVKSTRNWL